MSSSRHPGRILRVCLLSISLPRSAALATTPVKHFINLSNGCEALELLANAKVDPSSVSFCRIQSSHCEAQDFNGILSNLDHNLLMHLALGFECRLYDFGSRGNFWEADGAEGAAEEAVVQKYVPRALWWGLEWSRYALNHLWHLEDADAAPPLLRGYNVENLFRPKLNEIPKPLHKKLKYYRSYVAPGLTSLRLKGYFTGTELDGDKEAYRAFLLDHVERATAASAAAGQPPEPETFGMEFYDARTARRVGEMRGRTQMQ